MSVIRILNIDLAFYELSEYKKLLALPNVKGSKIVLTELLTAYVIWCSTFYCIQSSFSFVEGPYYSKNDIILVNRLVFCYLVAIKKQN